MARRGGRLGAKPKRRRRINQHLPRTRSLSPEGYVRKLLRLSILSSAGTAPYAQRAVDWMTQAATLSAPSEAHAVSGVMKSLKCPNRECPLAGVGNIIRHGFYQTKLGKASSISVPELREDILREHRHTLLSTPTSSRHLRRSRRTQRGGPEQVCNHTGKADRLEYRRSMARKGSPFVSSV